MYLAIDIGAGQGTKCALFSDIHSQLSESCFNTSEYGKCFESYAEALVEFIRKIFAENNYCLSSLKAIGISSAGILKSDGSFHLVQNLPHFNNYNLKSFLSEQFSVPCGIENDANAGGLAEWSVLQVELLYWVFGGGWGGSWISADGQVLFPSHDWDGKDESLHYTNEPGYSLPLEKLSLKNLFNEVNASYERFERILSEDLGLDGNVVCGPGGDSECIRAEHILSGPGRCRLFRAIVGDDDFYERFLDIHESSQMSDPQVAGKYISKLSSMRVEAAVNTDRLYGKVLANATRIMIKAARKDGVREGIPICLGGKPSYALPYFGPSAQRAMGRFGLMNYLRPSALDERGMNANLVGASVLAEKALKKPDS